MVEERDQVGIGRFVVDDKASIDVNRRPSGLFGCDSVGMASRAVIKLQNRDLMAMLRQEPGSAQPRNAAAHDSDK